jgi:hypothetical protein
MHVYVNNYINLKCTFSDFTDEDLARILHVFPGAYRVQALKLFDGGSEIKTFQLEWPVGVSIQSGDKSKITEDRKRRFKERLRELIEITDIPCAPLPAFRELETKSASTKSALGDLLTLKQRISEPLSTENSSSKRLSVLERVRLKEQRKKELEAERAKLTNTEGNLKQSRLPQIVNYIDGLFFTSKRNAMYIKEVTRRLIDNFKSPISEFEVNETLEKLAEKSDGWLVLDRSEFGVLVKIDQTKSAKSVIEQICWT